MHRHRRTSLPLALFLAVLAVYAYFYNGGSWGQNARYDVIFAFVEPGPDQFSFRINRFLPRPERNINTGDWSYYEGSYYSNKAPGSSLLGIPVYAALYLLQRLGGAPPDNPFLEIANAYVINVAVSGTLVAIAVLMFYKLLLLLGLEPNRALPTAGILAFGTMLFPYSTQLWGHPSAAAFIVFSLYGAVAGRPLTLFLAGASAGAAVLTDLLAAALIPPLLIWAMLSARKTALYFVLGGIGPALLFGWYNYVCFGSPFALPTDYTNPEFIDEGRALGLFGAVSLDALWQLTFGEMRGLFVSMPVLLASPIGLFVWLRRSPRDSLAWLCLTAILLLLVINASFNGWHGGATVCARYQIMALPFWLLPLKELLAHRTHRTGIWILGGISALNMFVIAAVSPIAPDIVPAPGAEPQPHPNPLFGWAYPSFVRGELAQFKFPLRLQLLDPNFQYYVDDTTWNLGQLLGLPGLWSLLPLLLFLPAALVWVWSKLPGKASTNKLGRTAAGLLAVLLLSAAADKGRLLDFAQSYHLLLFGEGFEAAADSYPISRAFPHYEKAARLRERILSEYGRTSVRLEFSGDRAVLQRMAEILYPVRLQEDARLVLSIEDERGEFRMTLREEK